jgi:hypothetical protein
MLQSVKQLFEDKLGASDGEIGHVKDFYFDDGDWAVRYVVADTGSWMPERLVLISPHAINSLYQGGRVLIVNLTRKQIEDSPPIEAHKPVSRQYEEEYHRYYGWPFYWQGGSLWGTGGFPILEQRSEPFSGEQATEVGVKRESADAHLRSAQALIGYGIQTRNEAVGHVSDFLIDDKSWAIQHLVIDIGHWFSSKSVLIAPSQIDRISSDESKLLVNVTKEAVLHAPAYDPASFGAAEHDPRIFS